MPKAIVFGSMNMDLSIEASRMPAAGETIAGRDFLANPGGKGGNQALAAARLGARVHMLAAVGADDFGAQLVGGLELAGVDCARVRRLAEVPTGVAVILRAAGDNRIVLGAGANHELDGTSVGHDLTVLAQPGDVFLAQGECHPQATVSALHAAHELGCYVMYNPAPARAMPTETWRDVDLVCLNETECQIVCGVLPHDEASCTEALRRLRDLGVGTAVITLGAAGSVGATWKEGAWSTPVDEPLHVPAVEANVVDTTGAGDTFIGALVAARLRGMPLERAMAWGAAAAGVTVSRVGAQQAIPAIGEVPLP